jgi:hypothetical protein
MLDVCRSKQFHRLVLLFVAVASIMLKSGNAEEFFFDCNDLFRYCSKVNGNCLNCFDKLVLTPI